MLDKQNKPLFCRDDLLPWVGDVKQWFSTTDSDERGRDREKIAYDALFVLLKENHFGKHKTITRTIRYSKEDMRGVDIEVRRYKQHPMLLQVKSTEDDRKKFSNYYKGQNPTPCAVIKPQMTFTQVKEELLDVLSQYLVTQ